MIYITYNESKIKNIWRVNSANVDARYVKFMQNKAKELDIVINPHWLNIMNHEDHNNHLTAEDYKEKSKQWLKILRFNNIDRFIHDEMKGVKLEYKNINRF